MAIRLDQIPQGPIRLDQIPEEPEQVPAPEQVGRVMGAARGIAEDVRVGEIPELPSPLPTQIFGQLPGIGAALGRDVPLETSKQRYVRELKTAKEKGEDLRPVTSARIQEKVGEVQRAFQAPHTRRAFQEEAEELKGKFLSKTYRRWERGSAMVVGGGLHLAEELTRVATLGKYGNTPAEWARMYHETLQRPEMQAVVENTFDKYFGGAVETGPFLATALAPAALTGGAALPSSIAGFLTAYAVEGNNVYQTALDRGESEHKARFRGIAVGIVNGGIEVAGGSGGKYFRNKQALAKAVSTKLAKAKTFSRSVLKNALKEGLVEELPQEAVSMLLGGDVPRKEDGSVDYEAVASRLTDAAIMGTILGGAIDAPMSLVNVQRAGRLMTEQQVDEKPAAVEEPTIAKPLSEPSVEETVQALTPEGEDKPRVRLRAEPRSKKELLWRGHVLPEAFGLDEESRRDLMEEVVGKRSMKDMTPEEQESFVAYAEGLAEQSGIEIETPVIDRAVSRLQEISKKKEKLTPTEELHQSKISKAVTDIKSWVTEAYHSLQRPERFIESLDGEEDGVLKENIWKPTKAADEAAILNTTAGVEEYTRLLEENMIDPALLISKEEKVGPGVKLTRDEQIGVYLLSQNENGKKYLNEGMKISDTIIADIVNNLSQTERMLGDWMAEQYELQWPTILAAAEQAGIDSEKLVKELNYAPIIRSNVDPLEQVDFTDMLAESFTKESFRPEQGFLEQRKKRAIGKIELSSTLMYLNNVRRIERFKAMAPVAKKVGTILRNQEFKNSLNDATYGHGSKLLNTWLRDTIKGYSPSEQDLFAKTTKVLRRNAIVYAIGYNVPSSLRQTLSLSNAVAVNPLMVKYVPINLAKATKNFSKLRNEVRSKSTLEPARDYERDLRQKWDKSALFKKLKGKDPFSKKATAWIKWMDQHTVVVAWKSLYDTAIEQGKAEEAAIEYADKWVGRTQPMANPKDLPQFFRGGTLAKLITTFQNQINNNWNFYTHDIIGARVSRKISNTEVAYRVMFSYILPAIAFGMIGRGGLPKSWKQLTVDLVTYPIATIMLLGRLINRAIKGWDNSSTIVEAGPEEAVKTVKSLLRGDIKKAVQNAAKTVGAFGGVPPTAQMSRTFTGVVDLATGDTKDPRRLIWSEWALEQGKKSTTRRTPPTRRRPSK